MKQMTTEQARKALFGPLSKKEISLRRLEDAKANAQAAWYDVVRFALGPRAEIPAPFDLRAGFVDPRLAKAIGRKILKRPDLLAVVWRKWIAANEEWIAESTRHLKFMIPFYSKA